MYENLVKRLRNRRICIQQSGSLDDFPLLGEAADAIEKLQRICDAMKPKHDAVCVKCAYYAEAKINAKGFLICPASGMDITAWDFCSYFEPPSPPDHVREATKMVEPQKEDK